MDIGLDGPVVLFALGLTLLAGLVAGLLPALHAARSEPGELLRDQSRGSTGLRLGRFSRLLEVAEIALSCALLVPTGLTVKGLVKLARIELGFPADRLLTAQISLDSPAYESPGLYASRPCFRSRSRWARICRSAIGQACGGTSS